MAEDNWREERMNRDFGPSALGQGGFASKDKHRREVNGAIRMGRNMRKAQARGDVEGYLKAIRLGPVQTLPNAADVRETAIGVVGKRSAAGDKILVETNNLLSDEAAGKNSDNGQENAEKPVNPNGRTFKGSQRRAGQTEEDFASETAKAASIGASDPQASRDALDVNASPSTKKTFAEIDSEARMRSEESGAFGSSVQFMNPRATYVNKVNELRSKEGGMTDSDKGFAKKRGKELGLNDDQIYDALEGEADLSPEAVSSRSSERKKKEQSEKSEISRPEENKTQALSTELQASKDRINSSLKLADEARSKSNKSEARLAESQKLGAETEKQNTEDTAKLKEKIEKRSEFNSRYGAAEDVAYQKRKELISSSLETSRNSGVNAYTPFFVFDGNWAEDSSIMPTSEEVERMSSSEVSDLTRTRINQQLEIARNFNKYLGGKSKYVVSPLTSEEKINSNNPFQTSKRFSYDTDAFSSVKNIALGIAPNAGYDPSPDSDIFGEMGDDWLSGVRRVVKKAATGLVGGNPSVKYNPVYSMDAIDAQMKIINAAERSGMAIWEDKELMGNQLFKKKFDESPVLKKRMKESISREGLFKKNRNIMIGLASIK